MGWTSRSPQTATPPLSREGDPEQAEAVPPSRGGRRQSRGCRADRGLEGRVPLGLAWGTPKIHR